MQPSQRKPFYVSSNAEVMIYVQLLRINKSQALCYKVVLHKREGASGEEVDRDVPIADITSTTRQSVIAEALSWDVGEASREDGVLGFGERRSSIMLIGVVATTSP